MKKKITLTESELIGVIKEIRDNIQLRRRFKEGLDENEVIHNQILQKQGDNDHSGT
jgi:hypothetical protein